MLPLWKPLLVKSNEQGPVIFNVFGDEIRRRPYRPFVIFYDDKEDCYYYLRARSSYGYKKCFDNQNNIINQEFKIKLNKYELEIPKSDPAYSYESQKFLFLKDSLIDCSQIFKCDKDLLESLVEIDELYKNTNALHPSFISLIKNNILRAISEVPPYISIVEIKLDENARTYGESLYISESFFDDEVKKLSQEDEMPNFMFFNSIKSLSNDYSNQRYWNGINFCKLFLNEYYPNLIDQFEKIQHLNDENNENENNSFTLSR